jgi:hypothetical protein
MICAYHSNSVGGNATLDESVCDRQIPFSAKVDGFPKSKDPQRYSDAIQEVAMLIAAKKLCKCVIEGADGTVGSVKDLLFDDRDWRVRYFDVDTGHWLSGRRVILSPQVIRTVDYIGQKLATPFDREIIKAGPPLEENLPVSRQKEIELAGHYAWGAYWANMARAQGEQPEEGDPHLRSSKAVTGYRIEASDGEIGHVEDFIVDDQAIEDGSWSIRYLVIDTRNWLPGKHVLVPPLWSDTVDWDTKHVKVEMTREQIKDSPEYDLDKAINRQYEEVFYDYYGRPRYWHEVGSPV